jgi:hydrogenase expression/formation protein HypC
VIPHPRPPADRPGEDGAIAMCLAVPGRIREVFEDGALRMADVDFGGVVKRVCLAYLPDADVGEYVIVHVGFAIQRLDEASALATLDLFRSSGLLAEEFDEPVNPGTEPVAAGADVPGPGATGGGGGCGS